MITSLLQCQG